MSSKEDKFFMLRACALARRGCGLTSPNPAVGALIVKEGRIVSKGWHRICGGSHAEVDAILNSKEDTKGSTLYVTLEPCNHHGKTAPCTLAILNAGIKRVVYAHEDPNSEVIGGGGEFLRENGIEVVSGCCREVARKVLLPWLFFIKANQPYVSLKIALTCDDKIATLDPNQPWISTEVSRAQVQRQRARVDAILVGAKTVITDNPKLTNRLTWGKHPLKVVLDSKLSTDPNSLCYDLNSLVFTTKQASSQRIEAFRAKGIDVFIFESEQISLKEVLKELAKRNIVHLYVEGGAEIARSFLRQDLVNTMLLYQSSIISAKDGLEMFNEKFSKSELENSFTLESRVKVSNDLLSIYCIKKSHVYGNC